MDFLNYVGANYDSIVANCKRNLRRCGIEFDYDLFADTILKCNDKLKEHRQDEYERYLFVALKNNSLRVMENNVVSLDEDAEIETEEYDDLFDKVENCIKDEFGEEWYGRFLEHANGKKYEDFDKELGNVRYQFRKIREFVRNRF